MLEPRILFLRNGHLCPRAIQLLAQVARGLPGCWLVGSLCFLWSKILVGGLNERRWPVTCGRTQPRQPGKERSGHLLLRADLGEPLRPRAGLVPNGRESRAQVTDSHQPQRAATTHAGEQLYLGHIQARAQGQVADPNPGCSLCEGQYFPRLGMGWGGDFGLHIHDLAVRASGFQS